MEFRQSKIGDLDQIVCIAEDAKAFLRSSGVGSVRVDTHPDNAAMRAAGDPRVGYEWILR